MILQTPRIALLGMGKMGRELDGLAQERGVEVVARLDVVEVRDRSAATFPARAPQTRPSSSELLASRFAPCRPVDAASPQASNPLIPLCAARSTTIPPTV